MMVAIVCEGFHPVVFLVGDPCMLAPSVPFSYCRCNNLWWSYNAAGGACQSRLVRTVCKWAMLGRVINVHSTCPWIQVWVCMSRKVETTNLWEWVNAQLYGL